MEPDSRPSQTSPMSPSRLPPPASSIQDLPNELLVHILSFLDSPSDSQKRLQGDPTKITRPVHGGSETPVKNASLVCHLWRRSVLQLLFRHVVWPFQRFYKPLHGDIASQIGVLECLNRNGLSKIVESFTILIDPPKESGSLRYADGQFWGLLPPEDCPPEPPKSANAVWNVFSTESQHFSSTQGQRPASADGLSRSDADTPAQRLWDNNWLWHTLFSQIDPLRITFVSSADIISSLLSRSVDLTSEWAFNSHHQILSLSRASRSASRPSDSDRSLPSQKRQKSGGPIPSDLFSIRDWTSLLVNEGSFAPVYSTYEFFHYSPPTLLPVILSTTDTSFTRLQETARSFSYVGAFPLSRHIRDVVVPYCPPVEHLFIKLMPSDLDFWSSSKLSHIDITDLWLECDSGYSMLMHHIFGKNPDPTFKSLRVFESGDSASEEAWNMAMQYVYMHGLRGWKLKKTGYFVRDASSS